MQPLQNPLLCSSANETLPSAVLWNSIEYITSTCEKATVNELSKQLVSHDSCLYGLI
jgi:hypothetical protein